MASAPPPLQPGVLADPGRVAAARRLLAEATPGVHDRLARLAAQLTSAPAALVCLRTDVEVPVGCCGVPASAVSGPLPLDGSPCAVTVELATPVAVPEAAHDERLAALPAAVDGALVAYLAVPLCARSGQVVGALAVFDGVPRAWSADQVASLDQLAASLVAELELSAARSAADAFLMRLELALEAGAVGTGEVDLRRDTIDWDERCAAIFGYDPTVRMGLDRLFGERRPDGGPAGPRRRPAGRQHRPAAHRRAGRAARPRPGRRHRRAARGARRVRRAAADRPVRPGAPAALPA